MRRIPLTAIALTATLALALVACDDGGSDPQSKPDRSTTTSSSTSTTTTTVAGGATTTTAPGTSTTVPPDSTGTCGTQTAAILAAISQGGSGLQENAGKYTVTRCRIAASSPIYAAANTVPNPGVQLDGATVVLERIGALWNVTGVGTSNTGCDLPAPVIAELQLAC